MLLSIILHMAGPADDVFEKAKGICEPPKNEVYMNKLLYRLHREMTKPRPGASHCGGV